MVWFAKSKKQEEDNVGYLVVATIANGLKKPQWEEEFLTWYKTSSWLTSYRAASVFLMEKFEEIMAENESLKKDANHGK